MSALSFFGEFSRSLAVLVSILVPHRVVEPYKLPQQLTRAVSTHVYRRRAWLISSSTSYEPATHELPAPQ